MTVVILPYWQFLVLCASLAAVVWWPGRPCVVWLVCGALVVMTLTGCASTPEPEEPPEPLPTVVLCALPAGMTETKTEPVTPGGFNVHVPPTTTPHSGQNMPMVPGNVSYNIS